MKPEDRELTETLADQNYWNRVADALGLKCYGFTYRRHAGFHDAKNDRGPPVEIPGWLADRILALDEDTRS